MKARPTIGIISPGDMGHAIGTVLVQHSLRVLTNLQGRSARTVALARQAGITDVSDDETLVREADMLLSVLVPAQAYAFAERIAVAMRATGSTPLFADCNAISPRTVFEYFTNADPGSNSAPLPANAVALANGGIMIADQFNDRVLEVNAPTKFQYGTINVTGNGPGQLDGPYTAYVVGDYTGQTPPPATF